MAISYEDALATLQSMFSDQGYTTQQLDAVLRHQGGHMENTVLILLNHGDETPESLIEKLPTLPVGGGGGSGSGGSADTHNINADEELARQLAAEFERQPPRNSAQQGGGGTLRREESAAAGRNRRLVETVPTFRAPATTEPMPATPQTSAVAKGRGIPTVLPSDFLRIPGRKYPASNATAVSDPRPAVLGSQVMSDENLARMLQDELFQEELRNNPEFYTWQGDEIRGQIITQEEAAGR